MNWRQYPNAVNRPAARIFGYAFAASFGLFEMLALFLLWQRDATLRDAAYWYLIAASAALAVGGFTGWASFIRLHWDYIDLSEKRETVTSTDHGIMSQQARGIPLNDTDQIIIHRPAKRVDGVLFQGAWLERMYAALQDGNQRFTRDVAGISGSAYPDCRQALLDAGYIDDNNDYTEAGKQWLASR